LREQDVPYNTKRSLGVTLFLLGMPQTEKKSDDRKDSSSEELGHASNEFFKHYTNILLQDFNGKWNEHIFWNQQLGTNSNDNGVTIVNFATSYNLSKTQCSNIRIFINTHVSFLTGRLKLTTCHLHNFTTTTNTTTTTSSSRILVVVVVVEAYHCHHKILKKSVYSYDLPAAPKVH
jgi:hypothetical protein